MNSSRDVIVFDEEYMNASKEMKDYCEALINKIDSYSKSVNVILEKAINDEKISENLRDIISHVETLKTEIEAIGQKASEACRDYVNEIDEADRFLY